MSQFHINYTHSLLRHNLAMLQEQLDGYLHGKERKQNLASKLTFPEKEEEKQKKYSVRAPSNRCPRGSNSYIDFKQMRNDKQFSPILLTQILY